jgi:hypothetical protein
MGEKPDFPVIFRGQISRCGIIQDSMFPIVIDSKEFKNNLQRFKENLYPQGV